MKRRCEAMIDGNGRCKCILAPSCADSMMAVLDVTKMAHFGEEVVAEDGRETTWTGGSEYLVQMQSDLLANVDRKECLKQLDILGEVS